jgi:hypothetical protein
LATEQKPTPRGSRGIGLWPSSLPQGKSQGIFYFSTDSGQNRPAKPNDSRQIQANSLLGKMQGQLVPETPPWFDAIPPSKRGWPKRSEDENPRGQAVHATA